MNSKYTFLGIAIISFAVVLVSSFLLLFFTNDEEFSNESSLFYSKYIVETDSSLLKIEQGEETFLDNKDLNPEKQGDIKIDESRKVVKFEDNLSESQKKAIESKYNIKFTSDQAISGIYSILTSDSSNLLGLENDLSVDSIEIDYPVKISADIVDWGVSRVGADKVWTTSSGSGVTVAIIDTGIQLDHPDLRNNIVSGYDFVNNRTIAQDDNGHGTHVAGIVAATSNQAGIIGTSHTAKLMPVKVLNSTGSGYISDVAKGIYWATDNGAHIINMSLGSTVDTDILRKAVNYASNKGVLQVAAAGNSSGAPCQYPAAYSQVICVVAIDKSNRLASFSNIGGELSAPGVSNYSTFLGGTYRYLSGTSMASPHVAGSLAIVKNACKTCSSSELRTTLRETSVDLGEPGQDIIFGYGLIDLVAAMEKLLPSTEESPADGTPVTEEPKVETPKEPSTTSPVKKGFDKQKPVITNPKKDSSNKFTVSSEENIIIQFKLEPITSNTGLDRIVLYINNDPVYTTSKQDDEYTLQYGSIEGVQVLVRVISYFKDGGQAQDQVMLDFSSIPKGRLGDNIIRRGRNVLGISTGFSLRGLFGL
jgi:subtilisin family serine protease